MTTILYLAMSFPGSGVESAYRNNLKDVAKMLKTRHQDNYMVFVIELYFYELCIILGF